MTKISLYARIAEEKLRALKVYGQGTELKLLATASGSLHLEYHPQDGKMFVYFDTSKARCDDKIEILVQGEAEDILHGMTFYKGSGMYEGYIFYDYDLVPGKGEALIYYDPNTKLVKKIIIQPTG